MEVKNGDHPGRRAGRFELTPVTTSSFTASILYHDHELQAARQATGLSSKGYAGYLSQAVKVQNKESGHATAFRP